MIRLATMEDVPRIFELCKEAWAKSRHSQDGALAPDADVKKFLAMMIHLNKGKSITGTHCNVAVKDKVVEGFHLGFRQRVHQIGSKLEASDALFYVSRRAHFSAAHQLLDSFVAWATSDLRVIKVMCAVSDLFEDWEKTELFYKRHGFRKAGVVYVIDLTAKEMAA